MFDQVNKAAEQFLASYDWCGGTPFDIQRSTVKLLVTNPRAYVLNSMGTGKTKAVLWAYDALKRVGGAKKMLVVAPLSTLRFTWAREIFMTTPHLKYSVVHGTREKRRAALAEDVDIYIINHDGIGIMLQELVARPDIDVVVFDELAVFRNRNQRTRFAAHLSRCKPVVWGLTGSPTPNAPTDVYQQAKIITPHTVPKFYTAFREQTMLRISQFKWVPKRDANLTAMRALSPHVRYTLDDILELPPFISRQDEVAIGPKQQKIYTAVKNAAYAMIQSGEVRAANAGAVMSKLLQISLGWVYLDDGTAAELDGQARIAALIDIIEAAEGKVIVFVPFKHALAGVTKALIAAGKTVAQVDGDTPPLERDKIFRAFQNDADPGVLAAHPQCVAHGITLTRANVVVWFGPITSSEIYEQANARIRRVGQTLKQLFLHLWATPVERHIYRLLGKKIVSQDDLLKMLEDQTL
jgi:SNF2 family DNA or RNA helicase